MQLTYEQYLYSCLADCIDDEWKNLEYDIRFQWLSQRYSWFEESRFNVDENGEVVDKSEYDCIVDYLTEREALRTLIKSHDFTYHYSNDHRMWKRGNEQAKAINELKEKFVREDFIHLWNEYAPDVVKIKT